MTTAIPAATHDGHEHVAGLVPHRRPADLDRAQGAARELLEALGLDPTADGLAETPARVARLYEQLLTPEPFRATTFDDDVGYDELVLVADWLQTHLVPKGVGVVVEAEHLCMSIRGVRAIGARTVTSSLYGLLRDDPSSRQEFLGLARSTT